MSLKGGIAIRAICLAAQAGKTWRSQDEAGGEEMDVTELALAVKAS